MEPDTLPAQRGYSETIVKVGFEGITLRQLVAFLEAVETSGVIAQIGSLHIRKDAKNETRLISILHIHSPQIGRDAIAADLTQG